MKILILSARLPYPYNTGSKIRSFQLMGALASRHQVTLLSFYGDVEEEVHFKVIEKMGIRLVPILRKKIDASVGIKEVLGGMVSRRPFTVTKYHDNRMSTALKELLDDHDVVHCAHVHMAQYLSKGLGIIKVLDAQNVEAQIAERLVHFETNPIKKVLLSWNSMAMHRFEMSICKAFDLVLTVSAQDCNCYTQLYRAKNARVLENGVDLNFFGKAPAAIEERLKLVFVGMMGWMPNSDGVKYFVSKILPTIKKEFPSIEIDFVGKDPPEDVRKLSEISGVRVTGTVDDVRPYVWNSQVYIVPLRFGGGTRLKILEAFSMQIPVVSTSLGCEGIECRHEKELLIADTASEFADAVIRLLRDPALRAELSKNAEQLVKRYYGWQSLGEKLLQYYDDLAVCDHHLAR
ncbi:MAG: glycosyltransferase family 4 protein [Proteobacteria bacterium]|nr:glycosyltransferase family 4 protein [Pseudomonadota bacterium]